MMIADTRCCIFNVSLTNRHFRHTHLAAHCWQGFYSTFTNVFSINVTFFERFLHLCLRQLYATAAFCNKLDRTWCRTYCSAPATRKLDHDGTQAYHAERHCLDAGRPSLSDYAHWPLNAAAINICCGYSDLYDAFSATVLGLCSVSRKSNPLKLFAIL